MAAFGIVISRLFAEAMRDVPRIFKTFQTAQSRDHLLGRLEKDMLRASEAADKFGELEYEKNKRVLIRAGKNVIEYVFEDGKAKRNVIGAGMKRIASEQWDLPRTVFEIERKSRGGNNIVLEVVSYIEQSVSGGKTKVLRTARMLFAAQAEVKR